jgi:hypothetical protein
VEPRIITFTIELDANAEPITGRLRLEGDHIPFAGWVALAGALVEVINDERARDA